MFIYVYTCVAYALDCSSCLSIDNCFLNKTKGPCFWGLIVVYLFRGIIFMFCFGWSMAAPFWILLLATATITLVTFTVITCLVWAQAWIPGVQFWRSGAEIAAWARSCLEGLQSNTCQWTDSWCTQSWKWCLGLLNLTALWEFKQCAEWNGLYFLSAP